MLTDAKMENQKRKRPTALQTNYPKHQLQAKPLTPLEEGTTKKRNQYHGVYLSQQIYTTITLFESVNQLTIPISIHQLPYRSNHITILVKILVSLFDQIQHMKRVRITNNLPITHIPAKQQSIKEPSTHG